MNETKALKNDNSRWSAMENCQNSLKTLMKHFYRVWTPSHRLADISSLTASLYLYKHNLLGMIKHQR
jgi:hypothetical protein